MQPHFPVYCLFLYIECIHCKPKPKPKPIGVKSNQVNLYITVYIVYIYTMYTVIYRLTWLLLTDPRKCNSCKVILKLGNHAIHVVLGFSHLYWVS